MGLCCQSYYVAFLFEATAFDNIAHNDNEDNFISELHFVHQVVRAVPLFLLSLYNTAVNSLQGGHARDQLLLSALEGEVIIMMIMNLYSANSM